MSYLEQFINQQNSEATKTTYRRGLVSFLETLETEDLPDRPSVEDVIAWKEWMATLSGWSDKTQATYWAAVRSYYDWLTRQGIITLNPFLAVKSPRTLTNKTPNVPSEAAFTALMREADKCPTMDAAIVYALASGLRESEVIDLQVEDVINNGNTVILRVVGKGYKQRMVPLGEKASSRIFRWIGQMKYSDSGFVFMKDGRKLSRRQIQCVVSRICVKIGVTGVSPHSLRHHFATRMVRAGVDVFTLQKLLGHSSVSTTQIYVNMNTDDLVAAVAKDTM